PAVLVITSREAGYFKSATTTRLCIQVCEAMTLALAEYEREEELRLMAFTDSLTRLPNRNLFSDRLDGALIQAERTQAIVGVGILDVDHFKETNDRFGHDAGDAVLATTARRLETILNRESTAARLAGDEFGLILIGLSTETEITGVLERLRAELSQPIRYRESLLPVTISLGVTLYPQDPVSARTLLRHADLALYR
ncbi:diguanylate cyclase with PAS/PAC sensor, partial [mine drainage metagenome]